MTGEHPEYPDQSYTPSEDEVLLAKVARALRGVPSTDMIGYNILNDSDDPEHGDVKDSFALAAALLPLIASVRRDAQADALEEASEDFKPLWFYKFIDGSEGHYLQRHNGNRVMRRLKDRAAAIRRNENGDNSSALEQAGKELAEARDENESGWTDGEYQFLKAERDRAERQLSDRKVQSALLLSAFKECKEELAEARADAERWKKTWLRSDEAGEKHANGFLEERCAETERADKAEAKLSEQAAAIADLPGLARIVQSVMRQSELSGHQLEKLQAVASTLLLPTPTTEAVKLDPEGGQK